MKRREFIVGVAGMAAWPPLAYGQRPNKLPTIGFLGAASAAAWAPWTASFMDRLRELGWIEGRTIAVEFLWAEGRIERFEEIAHEFVRRNVDVIVTGQSALLQVKRVTSSIPIVFTLGNDPLATGLIASLARPGGNITGLSSQGGDVVPIRIELLRDILGRPLARLAALADVTLPASLREMAELDLIADRLNIQIVRGEIRSGGDIDTAFVKMRGADALYVCSGPLTNTYRVLINNLAISARMPAAHFEKQYLEGGGLIAYGPSYSALFRRAAEYVSMILRGAYAGDLPIEQPTKFDLVINLAAAKALNLTIPSSLLARADEVIE